MPTSGMRESPKVEYFYPLQAKGLLANTPK